MGVASEVAHRRSLDVLSLFLIVHSNGVHRYTQQTDQLEALTTGPGSGRVLCMSCHAERSSEESILITADAHPLEPCSIHMRLAFLLRPRRRLLMQLDSPRNHSPSPSSSLKRPFSHTPAASSPPSSHPHAPSDLDYQRPGKIPKLEGTTPSSSEVSVPSSSAMPPPTSHARRTSGPGSSLLSRMPPLGPSKSSGGSGRGRRGAAANAARAVKATLPEPVHDPDYVYKTYRKKPLKPQWEENPKSPLANFTNQRLKQQPTYECVQGIAANGKTVWRCVVS